MLWAIFSLISLSGACAMPLLQQHFKPHSLSMLFWLRLFSFLALLPVVLSIGLPTDPIFYYGTAAIALLSAITDIFYFNTVKTHGAGVVSRLLPGSALITFFLWLAIDPSLLDKYIAAPTRAALILGLLLSGAYLAGQIRKCSISMSAVRAIWPVMIGAALGPIAAKLVLAHADKDVAALAFVMTQGLVVALGYLMYQLIWRPVPRTIFAGKHSIGIGALIALASMISIAGKAQAYTLVENPAYVSMILFCAPFFIGLYDRLTGRPDDSNKWAGFGLVAVAGALVFLQL